MPFTTMVGSNMNIFLYILHSLGFIDITTCWNGGSQYLFEWLSSFTSDGLCSFSDNPLVVLAPAKIAGA